MKVILYEHGCPKCEVLKKKLDESGIEYTDITDIEVMKSKGFTVAPMLEVDDVIMNFAEAVKWIKEQN